MTQPATSVDVDERRALVTDPVDSRAEIAAAWLSLLALACLIVGIAGWAAGSVPVRGAGLAVFMMGGSGVALWAFADRLDPVRRVALALFAAPTLLVLVSMVMVEAKFWHPIPAFVIVCVITVPALGRQLLRPGTRGAYRATASLLRDRMAEPRAGLSLALLIVAGALCGVGIALDERHSIPLGGFIRSISPVWYAGLVVLVGVLAWAWRTDRVSVLAIGTVELGVVFTLTPAIVYGMPRSQSAEKHVALADHIIAFHTLGANSAIYNAWSGFFAAMAWLGAICGLHSTIVFATYWPVMFLGARLAALRYLAGRLLPTQRSAWIAVLLAMLVDSLGADYFSPQSFGFTVGLAIIGLALDDEIGAGRFAAIFAGGVAIAITHQLSPYVVSGILVVLTIFRLVRPWWTAGLVLVPTLLWTLDHRHSLAGFVSTQTTGSVSNFAPPSTENSVSPAHIVRLAELAVAVGVLAIGLVALLALIRGWRRLDVWGLALSPVVGFAAIAANAYGAEGLFRALLFAIPWLAILAVRSVSGVPGHGRNGLMGPVVALGVLTVCFLLGAFLLDGSSTIRSGDRAAYNQVSALAQADPGTTYLLQNLGPGDAPTNSLTNPPNERLLASDKRLSAAESATGSNTQDPVFLVTYDLLSYAKSQGLTKTAIFVNWSPASLRYAQEYRVQSPSGFQDLLERFRQAGYWREVHDRSGSVLFEFQPENFHVQVG